MQVLFLFRLSHFLSNLIISNSFNAFRKSVLHHGSKFVHTSGTVLSDLWQAALSKKRKKEGLIEDNITYYVLCTIEGEYIFISVSATSVIQVLSHTKPASTRNFMFFFFLLLQFNLLYVVEEFLSADLLLSRPLSLWKYFLTHGGELVLKC
jgi:hypothetical protein